MTLYELKQQVANYFHVTVAELTLNGQDMFLAAANQVRRQAELNHDFEFSRKLVTLSVNGVTGGSLDSVVVYGTSTAVNVKTVIEAGLFDENGNLRPVEWTTVAEGLERQREENPRTMPRYPTDGWYSSAPAGYSRFELAGSTVYRFPKDSSNNFTLGLEVYTMSDDWSSALPTATVTGGSLSGTYTQQGVGYGSPFFVAGSKILYYNPVENGWYIADGGVTATFEGIATDYYYLTTTETQSPAGTYTAVGLAGSPVVTVTSLSDVWTTHAAQYMFWGIITHLNYHFKEFVLRQEGNLGSPERLRDEALGSFINWDAYRFEQNRRHGR